MIFFLGTYLIYDVDDSVGGMVIPRRDPGAVCHHNLLGVGVVHGDPQLVIAAIAQSADHVLVV